MHQLAIAKSNNSTDLLLLVGDKIASRWAYDPADPALKSIGDLRDWDNQAAAGADLSGYQADLDSGSLEITEVVSSQCDLLEWMEQNEIKSYWLVSHGYPTGLEVDFEDFDVSDFEHALEFIEDASDYWGEVDTDMNWSWDCRSGQPVDDRLNTIVNLKFYTEKQYD
jgi:hypothetical protein